MKIGQRLALRFTLVSALLTGAILVFIYTLTRGFVHRDFIERLTQQASLEVLHFATPHVKEVIPPGSFLLVNPQTSIYSREGKLLHREGNFTVPESWINNLKSEGAFNAERGSYTTVGREHTIDGKGYLVFVSDKDLPGQHELDILQKAMAIGWALSIVLSYLAGLYFAGNALQPVKQVVKEVNRVTKDNLSYRLSVTRDVTRLDEIDELILTFNALLERIELAFIAQKSFLQHASHELKTPLTAIMGEAELALAKERTGDEYQRTLSVIVTEAERLISITQGLLMLARLEEGYFRGNTGEIKIDQLLEGAVNSVKLAYPEREVIINGSSGSSIVIGNEQLLQIVLNNLLDNALKYSARDVLVSIDQTSETLTIQITDFGIGIPSGELSRVTSAMFRASNAAHVPGAGLGLSLVKRIMDVHGGSVKIESQEGKGTTCTLMLPLNAAFFS